MMPCGGPALSSVDTETIRRWSIGGTSRSGGAFHITTVDGVNYDFQAAGEFIFLREENLEVQARQVPVETEALPGPNPHTGLTSRVSVTTAIAVRVGQHRITYQADPNGGANPPSLQLRVDGDLVQLGAEGVALGTDGRIMPTLAPGGIQIEPPGGTVIMVTPGFWDYYQLPFLHIDARYVRATQGLMGVVPRGSWLPALRNGKSLGPIPDDLNQRYQVLYEKLGNDWRVSDAVSLFNYAPGTSAQSFAIADWPGEKPKVIGLPKGAGRKPPVKALALDIARQHASTIINNRFRALAIDDVRVTAEPSFAKTYALVGQIERNAPPSAPVLVYPEDNKSSLVNPITFVWRSSTDMDGDPIRYRLHVWNSEKTPNNNEAELLPATDAETIARTVARLQPGQTYFWKVIAEDGKGATVESETRTIETK